MSPQVSKMNVLGWQSRFPATDQVQLSKEASPGTQGTTGREAETDELARWVSWAEGSGRLWDAQGKLLSPRQRDWLGL